MEADLVRLSIRLIRFRIRCQWTPYSTNGSLKCEIYFVYVYSEQSC